MAADIQAQISELERVLGVEKIQSADADWLALMREGVIARLHIRRWRAKAQLELTDLGLTLDSADEQASFGDLLSLGEKRLLPADIVRELDSLESAGRKALERAGYATYWGILIPASNFNAWAAANADYRRRYLALGERIVAEYDAIREQLLAEYESAARVAYRRLRVLNPERLSPRERLSEYLFIDAFVARVAALIPSAERIGRSFAWDAEFSYIPLPGLLADDLAQAERARAQRVIERGEEELEAERQAAERRLVYEQERMSRDSLWRDAALEDGAAKERQKALRAMNDAVLAQAKAEKEALVQGFLRDVVVQLRSMVYEAATDVLAACERNGGALHPRSAAQLKNLFERVASLNFYGDREVAGLLDTVRATFDQDASARSVPELRSKLADVATVMRASLIGLGDAPRSAARLGVVDVPTDADVFSARQRLGGLEANVTADEGVPAQRRITELF